MWENEARGGLSRVCDAGVSIPLDGQEKQKLPIKGKLFCSLRRCTLTLTQPHLGKSRVSSKAVSSLHQGVISPAPSQQGPGAEGGDRRPRSPWLWACLVSKCPGLLMTQGWQILLPLVVSCCHLLLQPMVPGVPQITRSLCVVASCFLALNTGLCQDCRSQHLGHLSPGPRGAQRPGCSATSKPWQTHWERMGDSPPHLPGFL